MKVYKDFEELKEAPETIYNYFRNLEDSKELTKVPFMEWYGGDVHLIENEIDLIEIPTTVEAVGENRWKSITEVPDSYDSCRWLPDKTYVEIFMGTTDAGGPTFFIPAEIAKQEPNVLESIKMSNEAWS